MTTELFLKAVDLSRDRHYLQMDLQTASGIHRIYFRSSNAVFSANCEAFACFALLPCMKEGWSLQLSGQISERFADSLDKIKDIYHCWDPSLQKISISNASRVVRKNLSSRGAASFFSGGVDSFYTLLKHSRDITDIIFVHGFDIGLNDSSLHREALDRIGRVASCFGKRLIDIETNLRSSFMDPPVPWTMAHGAALAGLGHLMAPSFDRLYIPATFSYANLFPWGSHPLLDPLWSSESLEIIHDGSEASRVDKIALLSEHDIALKTLRVCTMNHDGAYNCGCCEKCLRTMISLKIIGSLDRCSTFEIGLSLKRVSKLIVSDVNERAFLQENVDAIEERRGDPELHRILLKVLRRPQWQNRIIERVRRRKRRTVRKLQKLMARYSMPATSH